MSKKIDELFSAERLRKQWRTAKTDEEAAAVADAESQTPVEIYESLRSLVDERFSGADAAALRSLLDELQDLLARLYPPEGEPPGSAEERIKLVPAVDEALCRIEDLAEAFEIAGRSRV